MEPVYTVIDEWDFDPDAWAKANFKEVDVELGKFTRSLAESLEQARELFGRRMSGSFAHMQRAIEEQRKAYEWNLRLNELRRYIPCSKGKAPFYIFWGVPLDCKQCRTLRMVEVGMTVLYCHNCGWERERVIKGVKPVVIPEFINVPGYALPDWMAEYVRAAYNQRKR